MHSFLTARFQSKVRHPALNLVKNRNFSYRVKTGLSRIRLNPDLTANNVSQVFVLRARDLVPVSVLVLVRLYPE